MSPCPDREEVIASFFIAVSQSGQVELGLCTKLGRFVLPMSPQDAEDIAGQLVVAATVVRSAETPDKPVVPLTGRIQ